jgi:hypothetical protein
MKKSFPILCLIPKLKTLSRENNLRKSFSWLHFWATFTFGCKNLKF